MHFELMNTREGYGSSWCKIVTFLTYFPGLFMAFIYFVYKWWRWMFLMSRFLTLVKKIWMWNYYGWADRYQVIWIARFILTRKNYVPPSRLGQGGTSRFTAVSCHPNVCRRPSMSHHVCLRQSVPDFVYISYSVSPIVFKFSDMVTVDTTLNWFTCLDYVSIFKVTGGHCVSKLTMFTWYCL